MYVPCCICKLLATCSLQMLQAARGADLSSFSCDAVLQELVQMESLAQVGVQLLLFSLGLEFSLSKLRAVRSVALAGEAWCCWLPPATCKQPSFDRAAVP